MADQVHDYLAAIGRKGGAAGRGPAKARTSKQARQAALARWGKRKMKAREKRSPNTHALAEDRSDDGQQRVVGQGVDQ